MLRIMDYRFDQFGPKIRMLHRLVFTDARNVSLNGRKGHSGESKRNTSDFISRDHNL